MNIMTIAILVGFYILGVWASLLHYGYNKSNQCSIWYALGDDGFEIVLVMLWPIVLSIGAIAVVWCMVADIVVPAFRSSKVGGGVCKVLGFVLLPIRPVKIGEELRKWNCKRIEKKRVRKLEGEVK